MFNGRKYYWIFQLIGWSCFFLWQMFGAWSVERMNTPEDRLLIIQRAGGFTVMGLIMTHLLRFTVLKLKILSRKLPQQIWAFVWLTLATSFITGFIELFLFKELHLLSKGESIIMSRSLWLILLNNGLAWFTFLITWSAIYFIYHYVSASQKEQMDHLKLRSHIKELELKTIKAHINPHFIFNSLNGIRAMVDEDPRRARAAITELSNILRGGINIDKSDTVPLTDELNIIKDYLALEQMRFENRLTVQYDIEPDTTSQQVPPMMWQMLVENAIKHGISHEMNGGLVHLISRINGDHMELIVENTGRLSHRPNHNGFGVKSIHERLELLYGSNASFEINQDGDHRVKALLRLPVQP
ncbi:hypothetical protein GCM10027051_08550 [Niabella terrae]